MTKDNLIPKTETVYELKNEIPSFEEFVKTYEYDTNLNYDDLNGGGIGEVKGYGPCERSCGWHNPKCTCYTSHEEGFVPLNTACPACSAGVAHKWVHNNCGGQSYISRRVRLKCMKCGTEGHWKTWSFRCSGHNNFRPLTNTSAKTFMTALGIAASMNGDDDESIDIVDDIVAKLIQERKDERR